MKKLTWRERLTALFRGQLATFVENESTFTLASRGWTLNERDRYDGEREDILADALEAWRLNPIARRIVGLTTQYVVGGGITVGCKHEATHRFINDFWDHRLNRMGVRCYELCDELTRAGNLFILLSTDASGMSYIRAVPAADIARIEHKPNDIEQPTRFWPKSSGDNPNPQPYIAYDPQLDEARYSSTGEFEPVMLQYTVNRPAGAQWGESDLAPVLKWLARYSNWLEDRARLNRFRNSFVFVVKSRFLSEADRSARQATLAAHPPQPGSILVCDESETWEILSPKLESQDAAADGLGLKKMIASGAGIPLHFLAEPESSTRTTAEAAGGPTYRHFEQRQQYFIWILADILKVAVQRRAMAGGHVSRKAAILVRGADISARDNVSLSMAGQNIVNMLTDLKDRALITNEEYLRIAYRFAGEMVDVEAMLRDARAQGGREEQEQGKSTSQIIREEEIAKIHLPAAASDASLEPGTARPARPAGRNEGEPETTRPSQAQKFRPASDAVDIETGEEKDGRDE